MDIDRLSNTRVEEYIKNTTKMILPQFHGFSSPGTFINFSQDFMGGAPGNPIFCEAAKENVKRRRSKKSKTYDLGPRLYTEMVSRLLFGIQFTERPSNRVKNEVQSQLHRHRDIVSSYCEIPPLHTIAYRSSETSREWFDRARDKLRGRGYLKWT